MVSIVFHSVVRDEEEHIGLLLASVKKSLGKHLTYWVIADSGSTDKTKQIIEESMKGIPGEIVDVQWEGFGLTRTKAIQHAFGKADYIAIADGDYSILGEGELPELTADCYMASFDGPITWRLPILLKDDPTLGWYWDGHVHETLYAKREYTRENIDELTYVHRATPKDLEGSLERNLKLLHEEWKVNPQPRTAFYLGATYCDMGKVDKSVKWFKKRLDYGDASDEAWFAQYQTARQLDDVEQLLIATEMGPDRVEPWYYLARHFRERNMMESAYFFAKRGMEIRHNQEDTMFVDVTILLFRMFYEFAVAAWKTDRKEDGQLIFDHLLTMDDLPDDIKRDIQKVLL